MKSKSELLLEYFNANKLSEDDYLYLLNNLDKTSSAAEGELKSRKKYPSIDAIPNRGQLRCLKGWQSIHPEFGDYSKIEILTGGNGSGKTAFLAFCILAGVCLGPEFVNQKHLDYEYFHYCAKIRRLREFHLRILCDSADMEESGSLYCEIKKWIPTAEFYGRTSKGYYTKVKIGDVHVDVKTFKQENNAHAGSTLDLILVNEPPPFSVWMETYSRLRAGGRIALAFTPLKGASYLWDVIHNEKNKPGEVYHSEVSIWDNCRQTPGTNGILEQRDIESLINQWEINCPDEVEARVWGKFQHLSGAIFKTFNKNVHVMNPFVIPPNWVIRSCIDPHLRKPPFHLWTAQDPLDNIFIIAEYPPQNWRMVKNTNLGIKGHCEQFKLLETGRTIYPHMANIKVHYRYGDPNMLMAKQPHNQETLQQEYAKHGYYFSEQVNNDIILGHSNIHSFLHYDRTKDVGPNNSPRLYVFSTCPNIISALELYAYEQQKDDEAAITTKINEMWKDPIDTLRYTLSKFRTYSLAYEDVRSKEKNRQLRLQQTGNNGNPALHCNGVF